jgi:hypothetical protein
MCLPSATLYAERRHYGRLLYFTSSTTDPIEVSLMQDTSWTGNSGSRIYILTHTGCAFIYSYTAVAAVHSEGTACRSGMAAWIGADADSVNVVKDKPGEEGESQREGLFRRVLRAPR